MAPFQVVLEVWGGDVGDRVRNGRDHRLGITDLVLEIFDLAVAEAEKPLLQRVLVVGCQRLVAERAVCPVILHDELLRLVSEVLRGKHGRYVVQDRFLAVVQLRGGADCLGQQPVDSVHVGQTGKGGCLPLDGAPVLV